MLQGVLLLFIIAMLCSSQACATDENAIAVIYPDIGEPYRAIFDQIIEGVEDKIGAQAPNYPVNADTDVGTLKASLHRQNTRVTIALGRQGMQMAMGIDNGIKVVVGGVMTVPEGEARQQPVISLTPDPALLFTQIKSLKPSVKRVFVVYNPAASDWLVRLAKQAAPEQGLELVSYEALNLHDAVQSYQKIFSIANSQSDALWLPQDSTTVEDSSILPLVLQESWNGNIAVFSSNFGYVRRGVLFSLFPDNLALGKSLGTLAQGILNSGSYEQRGMMPLRDVQSAINLRTAKHLGINPRRQQGFNMTFPEQ